MLVGGCVESITHRTSGAHLGAMKMSHTVWRRVDLCAFDLKSLCCGMCVCVRVYA